MESHSFMSAMNTVHLKTCSIEDPDLSRTSLMLSIVWRVSAWIPPGTTPPCALALVPICPARYRTSPTCTAGVNGRVGRPYGMWYVMPLAVSFSGPPWEMEDGRGETGDALAVSTDGVAADRVIQKRSAIATRSAATSLRSDIGRPSSRGDATFAPARSESKTSEMIAAGCC